MTDSDDSVEQTVKVEEPAHIKWGLQAIPSLSHVFVSNNTLYTPVGW